jgi:hypothetical protein
MNVVGIVEVYASSCFEEQDESVCWQLHGSAGILPANSMMLYCHQPGKVVQPAALSCRSVPLMLSITIVLQQRR